MGQATGFPRKSNLVEAKSPKISERNKIFNDGPTKGMQGQFSCVCQADGSMRCSSLSLPCIINDRGYEIGEKFKLYNYMDKHMDYEVKLVKVEGFLFFIKKEAFG